MTMNTISNHSISPSIIRKSQPTAQTATPQSSDDNKKTEKNNTKSLSPHDSQPSSQKNVTATLLTDVEKEIVRDLKVRDREVRAHEQAHKNAAGPYAKGISYHYERGPDGVSYAVSGEVKIDTSEIPGDPQATLEKAQQIIAAALAPAEPSQQDYAVAAEARQMATKAKSELSQAEAEQKETSGHNPRQATDAYTETENNNEEPAGTLVDLFI